MLLSTLGILKKGLDRHRETGEELNQSQSTLVATNRTTAMVIGGCLLATLPRHHERPWKCSQKASTNHCGRCSSSYCQCSPRLVTKKCSISTPPCTPTPSGYKLKSGETESSSEVHQSQQNNHTKRVPPSRAASCTDVRPRGAPPSPTPAGGGNKREDKRSRGFNVPPPSWESTSTLTRRCGQRGRPAAASVPPARERTSSPGTKSKSALSFHSLALTGRPRKCKEHSPAKDVQELYSQSILI